MTHSAPIATRDHVAVGASQPDPRACGWVDRPAVSAAVARDNTKLALWFVCPPMAAVVAWGDWLKLWTRAR